MSNRSADWANRRTRVGAAAAIGGVASALVWLGLHNGVFARYDAAAIDSLYPTGRMDNRIAVVAIDRTSVEEIGPWPWPRAVQADLVSAVARAGAHAIAYDLLLVPDSPDDDEIAAAFEQLPPGRSITAALPTDLVLSDRGLLVAGDVMAPSAVIARAAATAHTLVAPDSFDGVARETPLVIEHPDGTLQPSLALQAYAAMEGLEPTPILRPRGVQVGDEVVPTSSGWRMRISWPEGLHETAGRFTVSAADVLHGRGEDRLAGRTVLVGVTDATLGDRHNAPLNNVGGTPGVLLHAAALNTLATGAFTANESVGTTLAWTAALAAIAAVGFQVGRTAIGAAVALVAISAHVLSVVSAFERGTARPLIWPLLGVLLAALGGFAIRYFGEIRQRQRVVALFSRYVPDAAARELMHSPRRLAEVMAGQHLEVSVLFCDLRGFTPVVRALPPERVRDLLNVYYRRTCRLIVEHGGTVLQYVGDEVFAVFGAPVPDARHATRALECATALLQAQPDLAEELAGRSLPAVQYGVSVHSGLVLAAHVGDRHLQYAVVGDTVNIGSRLCGEAAAGEVVYSEAVRARVGTDPVGEACGRIPLKGVEGGVVVWRIAATTSPIRQFADHVAVIDVTDRSAHQAEDGAPTSERARGAPR